MPIKRFAKPPPEVKPSSLNGYEAAQEWGYKVDELLKAFPITKKNAMEWLRFSRTIGTTFKIIQQLALEKEKE